MSGIDWARIDALRADIGAEDFADVVLMFVAEIDETLARLRAAPTPPGAAEFHFLRGSAANLGFAALATACSAAETACRAGQVPDLGAVETAFAAALAEARPRLPGLTDAA